MIPGGGSVVLQDCTVTNVLVVWLRVVIVHHVYLRSSSNITII